MQVLIAHADETARAAFAQVAARVAAHGLEVVESSDGQEALELLLGANAPQLALVGWELPGLDGLELCRIVNQFYEARPPYVVLVGRPGHDLAAGLDAGASDCVLAPVDADELRARLAVGLRYARLLAARDGLPDTSGDVLLDVAQGEALLDVVQVDAALDATRDTPLGTERPDAGDTPRSARSEGAHAAAAASLEAEIRSADRDDAAGAGAFGAATLESVIVPE